MVILIADDEKSIRMGLHVLLKRKHEVILCEDGEQAIAALEKNMVDLVITDFQMPKMSGFDVIRKGKEISPSTSFLMMTANGSVNHAVDALQLGADDYVTKPFNISEIEHRVRKVEEARSWKVQRAVHDTSHSLEKNWIGDSRETIEAKAFIQSSALASAPVLLCGPRGVGKTLVARLIHEAGPQGIFPLVSVDCSQADPTKIELDLFGREATSSQPEIIGALELARGGTLLLEEVGSLPKSLQARLKRILEQKSFEKGGSSRKIGFTSRLISTTSVSLDDKIASGAFTTELLDCLGTLTLSIRRLSQREKDIAPLIHHFWAELNRELRKDLKLSDEALAVLTRHEWPGNVRQLKNSLERMAVLFQESSQPLGEAHLPPEIFRTNSLSLAEVVANFEKNFIRDALEACQYNLEATAKKLHVTLPFLREKMSAYDIEEMIEAKAA